MNDTIKRLNDRRVKLVEDARAIADQAATENRALTAEEQAQWDQLIAESDRVDVRRRQLIDDEARARDIDEALEDLGQTRRDPEGTRRAEELRSFLRGEPGSPRAFDVTPARSFDEYRDLSGLTGAAGGDLEPTDFYGRLVQHLIENAAVMQTRPTVIVTSGGNSIEIPKTLTHPDAELVAELGTIPESDPTFDKITLGAFKYARMVQISSELLADQGPGVDIEGYLARATGRALGNAFGVDAIVGTGSSEPRGVITDATVGKTGPTGTATSFGDQSTAGEGGDLFIDLFHSVIAPYRASSSCSWMMADLTAAAVRKLKTTDGDYVWQPALAVGQPDTILGKPVVFDPNVATPAANAKSVLFGDWSQFFVRLAGSIRFERSDDFAFDKDLVSFRAIMRADCALVDLTGAIKVFQHSAT